MEESGETDLCLSSPPRGNPRLPIGGTPPTLLVPPSSWREAHRFAFLNPTGEKNPCWSCFLFTALPRIVIPLIGVVQLPGKVSGGRSRIPGPERAPLPPQSSTTALNNGLFFSVHQPCVTSLVTIHSPTVQSGNLPELHTSPAKQSHFFFDGDLSGSSAD